MPKLSSKELAESYGFALSFLKSDKSLWGLFNKAVKGNWDDAKFVAEMKNTSFYKKNSETARQFDLLKTTDPATYRNRKAQIQEQIRDRAGAMGAMGVSGKTLSHIAENAMKFGWNDSQINNILADYVKATNGVYRGNTGNDIDAVRQTAYRNGIKISKATEAGWAHSIAAGNNTAEFFQRQVRQMAKSLAPGYAQELDSGIDLQDIVSPYIESKAKLLELNPADVDLFDNDIRKAVSGVTKDGKPASKSLWQFEQEMRQDSRWLKTQNAQDSVMSVGKKVLSDFGFLGVS